MEEDTVIKNDELLSPDKCRCCREEGILKELWSKYLLDGGAIIYGQVLVECFSLALHQCGDAVEKICVICIGKLQDAVTFKMLVLKSDKRLLTYDAQDEIVKTEVDIEYSQGGQKMLADSVRNNACSENENLDDDIKRTSPVHIKMELLEPARSQESIREKDQINIKTDMSIEKYEKYLEEIKTILKYTNATPYKINKNNHYICAYCRTCIEDPDELRSHTSTVHAEQRYSGVDVFMKRNWFNEILKMDITDLRCIVCPAPVPSWNDMFVHLKKTHKVELDEARNKVIPYKLTEPLKCALCEDKCNLYITLDTHMNVHYSNYVCSDCGDMFLARNRLKTHLLRAHSSTAKLKCSLCPKVFAHEKYRKKHVAEVHKKSQAQVFRCHCCSEEFSNWYRRCRHEERNHSEKIKTISCEYCEKIFTYKPYYTKHLQSHLPDDVEKKFKGLQ